MGGSFRLGQIADGDIRQFVVRRVWSRSRVSHRKAWHFGTEQGKTVRAHGGFCLVEMRRPARPTGLGQTNLRLNVATDGH